MLIRLVDGCPRIDSSLTHRKPELIWFYSGRRQLSFVEDDTVLSTIALLRFTLIETLFNSSDMF